MRLNIPLKIALIQRGVPNYESARQVNIAPERLSKIINGAISPRDTEKAALAQLCKRDVDELFCLNS